MKDPISIYRAQRAARREEEREHHAEIRAERMKTQAYAAYVHSGGLPHEFDQEWPDIRRRVLAEKAVTEGKR